MTQGVAGFQGALGQLAIQAGNASKELVRRIGGLSPAEGYTFVTDAYPELIDPFISASGEMTAQWYNENQPRPVRRAARIFTPEPAEIPDRTQIAASARSALASSNPETAIQGTSTRYVFDESRRTVRDNANRESVRYTRHASSNACGFCRMLATRVLTKDEPGAPGLYVSRATARRNAHKFDDVRGHDNCKCLVVPVRAGYQPPSYVNDWVDDYYAVNRNDDGALRPEWNIAYRMERRANERSGGGSARARAASSAPPIDEVVDLDDLRRDAGGQFVGSRQLFQRNSARAAEIAASARDRIAAVQRITARVDSYASTASTVTGNIKRVTDVADKTIGFAVPVVRDIKRTVDAADKATSSAAAVTAGVNRTVTLADTAIRDTERIAQGAKELADDVKSVIDDAAYIAAGIKQLLADADDLTDITAAAGLRATAVATAAKAGRLTDQGLELVDRAKGAVSTVQNYPAKVADIPNVLRAPLTDVEKLVRSAQGTVAGAHQAAIDASDLADVLRSLVDNVIDYRRNGFMPNYNRTSAWTYSERVGDELGVIIGGAIPAPKAIGSVTPPTWVTSERLDLPAPPRRLELTAAPLSQVDDLTDSTQPNRPNVTTAAPRSLDDVEAEFNAAIAAGADDATIDRLAGEMVDAEAAETRSAANAARASQRRAVAQSAKFERMGELIESGVDPIEAESIAFGISQATVRSRTILSEARSNGYQVTSVEGLVKQVFMERASEAYFAAEAATNGFMVKRKYVGKIDPSDLWFCTEKQARTWMSDEMAAWFDANGRITRAAVRAMIVDGDQVWRNPMTEDFLQ